MSAYEQALLKAWGNQADSAHDIAHIRRVWSNCLALCTEHTDQDVLYAACIFHDLVNLPKDSPDRAQASRLSAEAAAPLLLELGFPEAKLAAVQHAITAHSFSANITPETEEAQILQDADRLDALREFFPDAKLEDWHLSTAGQRVQIIKQHPKRGGELQFGTEIVSAADGSIAALLGASPGASTAVDVMVEILEKCFSSQMADWSSKLREILPSYGHRLADNEALYRQTREHADGVLGL